MAGASEGAALEFCNRVDRLVGGCIADCERGPGRLPLLLPPEVEAAGATLASADAATMSAASVFAELEIPSTSKGSSESGR